MKFRNTLWLILVFIALGLYLALIEVPTAKKKDEAETLSKQILSFKVEDVKAFDLIQPTGTLKIQRNPENSRWNITEPMTVPGENGVINQLLLTLEEAQITRVVDEAPKNLADFGLQNPSLKIALRFKNGEPKTLEIGDASPMGHDTYLKLGDEKRVLLSFIDKNQLKPSLNDLRDKTLLDFVARDITRVDLTVEKATQTFVKEGKQWKLTAPVQAQGDTDAISNFLNHIRSERIETFISDSPGHTGSLGLDPPRIVLHLQAEKAGQAWTLNIGKKFDEQSHYAQRDSPKNVVTVAGSLVDTLTKNPLDFMEKSLIPFPAAEVAAIESRDGKDTIRVVRDADNKGRWKFEHPENGGVDSATINTLLLDVQEARIQQFAPSKNLKLFGLHTPRKKLILEKKDGSNVTLKLGNTDRSQLFSFVTRSVDQSIFTLDTETVNKIFRARRDFKDKKLLKFDPEQVARIKLEYPNQTFQLEKQDKQWVLVQPEKLDDLRPFVGKDILWTLNNLEYDKKLDVEGITETTGLETPRLTLSLQDRNSNSLGRLTIGQPVKDQPLLYSQLDGNPALYHIKDRTLNELPDSLDRFRKPQD